MNTSDTSYSGPDADDISARAKANATLSSLIEASSPDLSEIERFESAVTAYGAAMAAAMNEKYRELLFTRSEPVRR
jgi:hypothetical protein